MILKELHFIAFGPFTNRELSFDDKGLHVVFGPNESGKSSALRGLKSLLYGINPRTTDNFIHENSLLRIGGVLQKENGEKLEIIRRKGTRNTLLNSEGIPLDEQTLSPFLQGINSTLFTTLFGIDHQELEQGGQEILDQNGKIGEVLFSAGLGNYNLNKVLVELENETDILFKKAGSKPTINALIRQFNDVKKEIKDKSLSSHKWKDFRRRFESTREHLENINSRLIGHRNKLNRLERIQRIYPKFARLNQFTDEFKELEGTIILSDEFTLRRKNAVSEKEKAETIVNKVTPRLDDLRKKHEKLSIDHLLLDHSIQIKGLYEQLGSFKKAEKDRPKLETKQKQYARTADDILAKIKFDFQLEDIERFRIILDKRKTISELGGQISLLDKKDENLKLNLQKEKRRLEAIIDELAQIQEFDSETDLDFEIISARKLGDLDALIDRDFDDLSRQKNECQRALDRLPLWNGTLNSIATIKTPTKENIHRFQEKFDHMKHRREMTEEKKTKFDEEKENIFTKIDEVRRKGEIPSENLLEKSRSNRDEIWQLLRQKWVDQIDISDKAAKYHEEGTLPDVFENRISVVDRLSDRLRREANRVHELANLESSWHSLERQLDIVSQELDEVSKQEDKLVVGWQKLWEDSQIDPLTPREMIAWLDEFEKLRDETLTLEKLQDQITKNRYKRKIHVHKLNKQMENLNCSISNTEELAAVLQECEKKQKQLNNLRVKRDLLVEDRKRKELDLRLLNEEYQLNDEKLKKWNSQWSKLMQNINLSSQTSFPEVKYLVEKLTVYYTNADKEREFSKRIKAIESDSKDFIDQVHELVSSIAPKLLGESLVDIVSKLDHSLSDNQKIQSKSQTIQEQIEINQQEITEAQNTIKIMNEQLHKLCEEARCESPDLLIHAERKSACYVQLGRDIDRIKDEIIENGDGKEFDELKQEVLDVDLDSLPGKIAELNDLIINELEPRRIELAEEKGRHQKELELFDGNDQVAELNNHAESILSTIRSNTNRYIQVKLALKILKEKIESYRKENQSPLIRSASQYFATLTCDSFQRLSADFNERDEPILTGIRPNGENVRVEGMSSGTRDQLYLALRLASFEKYIQNGNPMPIILDDVLVDFDDVRSQSALNAFAKIAEQTQVILFTHHFRIVEQSKKMNGLTRVHKLDI